MRHSFITKKLLGVLLTGIILAVLLAQPAAPDSFIWLDVSVKVIVDPATGQVPSTMNDALLRNSFADMNRWLANTWRGYRVRAVDLDARQNFKRIGALNDTSGPEKWYATDLKTDDAAKKMFENEAKANKSLYAWNDFAINLYFNNGGYSSSSYPSTGWDLVQSAYALLVYEAPSGGFAERYKVAANLLHEFGHFFELYHTFDEDQMADTAQDPQEPDIRNEPLVRESIAQHHFSLSFSALTDAEKTLVDNTANNVMSYYQLFYDDPAQGKVLSDSERFGPTRFLFTEMQMDRWGDYANGARAAIASGRMIFVKPGIEEGGNGSSANEFQLINQAVTAANNAGGDILLLRPGVYGGPMVISKPLTLRATRNGSALIGQ